jgi:hypothetical protein
VVAVPHGGRAHAAGVAAGVGLVLRQAPFELAADGRQQVLLLLLVVEVVEDRLTLGPKMSPPREGSAMLRASSDQTVTLATRPMPCPPYSRGTS